MTWMQLMQHRVQKSSSTTLPLRSFQASGLAVFSHAVPFERRQFLGRQPDRPRPRATTNTAASSPDDQLGALGSAPER